MEHSFSVPAPGVQLCVADNVLLALHWGSRRALLLDVCSSAAGRLQPITSPVALAPSPGSGVRQDGAWPPECLSLRRCEPGSCVEGGL